MTKARILVVDDEPGMLHAVERVLSPAYSALCLSSPTEALARVSIFAPDLVLLDIRMPEMSGFDLVDRLRERCPDVDVIFMTGSVEEIDSAHVAAILKKAFYFVQKPFDRRVLLTLVERCLELRRLANENRRHVMRLESEMAEACAFQRSLLPAETAVVAGVSIAARFVPCDELGGDLFGYHEAGSGRIALLIADVAGHGASAAMLTGVVKSAFDSSLAEGYDPLRAVERVAAGLRGFEPNKFVTLLCALIDTRRRTLTYVSAGHHPAILWGPSRAAGARSGPGPEGASSPAPGSQATQPPPSSQEAGPPPGDPRRPILLNSTGPIVSPALSGLLWQDARIDLLEGDRLLLYTDGLVEAERGEVCFGRERLLVEVARRPEGGAVLLDALLASALEFSGRPARDDVTLLTATL